MLCDVRRDLAMIDAKDRRQRQRGIRARLKAGGLRPGIDFLDRTSGSATRKRYLVNPVSALPWLNGAQPVRIKTISCRDVSASSCLTCDHPPV